jgi:hypothetical protein
MFQIKYAITSQIELQDFESESTEIDIDTEHNAGEAPTPEDEDFRLKFDEFWKERIAHDNQLVATYTFDNSIIRYERSQDKLPNEFIQIEPESGKMLHFFLDEETGNTSLSETYLHHNAISSGWNIKYDIEVFEAEIKNILGYECFKMVIFETRINKGQDWKISHQYELYVTDKICLPARLVIHLWEPITELCALEIKAINMKSPNSYSIKRAIEITEMNDTELISLPIEYAHFLGKNIT